MRGEAGGKELAPLRAGRGSLGDSNLISCSMKLWDGILQEVVSGDVQVLEQKRPEPQPEHSWAENTSGMKGIAIAAQPD